jgi:hypothetical protein
MIHNTRQNHKADVALLQKSELNSSIETGHTFMHVINNFDQGTEKIIIELN